MLRDRLLTSAVLISAVLGLLFLDAKYPLGGSYGWWLLPLLMVFSLGTARDLATMLKHGGRAISRRTVLVATGVASLSPCVPMLWPVFGATYPVDCPIGTPGWVVVGVLSAIFVCMFREICLYRPGNGQALERTLSGAFASVCVGVPMALMVVVRVSGNGTASTNPANNAAWGLAALVATITVTKSCDAGAYFTGRTLGRHKLIPHLSPGKTWEGALGGIVVSILVSYACFMGLFPKLLTVTQGPPWWGPLLFGSVCAVMGMIGDLAESLVKRETGVKDSGNWLPGLGGVWDVTDSLLVTIMPAWIMISAGLIGS